MTISRRGLEAANMAGITPTPRQPHAVRGWCPGALRPMESGDGLIVRVRPKLATLQLDAVRAICQAALEYGNGIIDLTQRANLQIRGLRQETLPGMHAVLRDHGLLDDNPQAEQVRNILVSPLANLDPDQLIDIHPVARALEDRLRTDNRLWALPGKFGFLLDSGAKPDLNCERADIYLVASRDETGTVGFKVGLDRPEEIEWLGTTTQRDPERLVDILTDIALAAIQGATKQDGRAARIRKHPKESIREIKTAVSQQLNPATRLRQRQHETPSQRPLGLIKLDGTTTGLALLALAAPFGSLDAQSWLSLLDAAQSADITQLRISPWRTIYLPLLAKKHAANVLDAASRAGFITDRLDPALRIDACPGAPRCTSAYADTRHLARQIASHMAVRDQPESVHVSGCPKGCARAAPADLMLTAGPDGYTLARNATASVESETTIPYSQLARLKGLLQRST